VKVIGSSAAAQEPSGVIAEESELTAPSALRDPVPEHMAW
jgi:hypothetical protein